MRISDWTSDVCSSDLYRSRNGGCNAPATRHGKKDSYGDTLLPDCHIVVACCRFISPTRLPFAKIHLEKRHGIFSTPDPRQQPSPTNVRYAHAVRSEERRIGKGGVRQGRTRWSPIH